MPKRQNSPSPAVANDALELFHPAVRDWFTAVFPAPTRPQLLGWPAIARGDSTLILAPTGTGKTLAAFLWCIDRLMFSPAPAEPHRCRILYISPIKALAVDVERNLQSPLIGIGHAAQRLAITHHHPTVSIRTGDTPPAERARFLRHPSDILVTTPESLYLLLTSNARESLRSIEAVILDETTPWLPPSAARISLSRSNASSISPAAASSASASPPRSARSTKSPIFLAVRTLTKMFPVEHSRLPLKLPPKNLSPNSNPPP